MRSYAGSVTSRPPTCPPGDVEVRVDWSSVNYKDALATIAGGKVARISPLIPGSTSRARSWRRPTRPRRSERRVLAHGYDLGVARHGGYGAYTRLPAGYVVPLPAGLSAREAMTVGTAGFTAAMSVAALERHGLAPGGGPVLVTGASGGVGSVAVAILAARGHEVWAATGKAAEKGGSWPWARSGSSRGRSARPRARGHWSRRVGRRQSTRSAPRRCPRSSGRSDPALRSRRRAMPAGRPSATTVLPFILRGVALLGMDSANMPIAERRALWGRIATDLRPAGLDGALGVTEVGLDDLERRSTGSSPANRAAGGSSVATSWIRATWPPTPSLRRPSMADGQLPARPRSTLRGSARSRGCRRGAPRSARPRSTSASTRRPRRRAPVAPRRTRCRHPAGNRRDGPR